MRFLYTGMIPNKVAALAILRIPLLIVAFVAMLTPSTIEAFDGPLDYVNRFPLTEILLSPKMESPVLADSMSAEVSYSSIYMVMQSLHWKVGLDFESIDTEFSIRKVFQGFELGLSLPVASNVSGFMDPFLIDFHNSLGLGDYGRQNRPDNSFLYEVRHDGSLIIQGKDGRVGLGDLRVTVKHAILEGDPAVSVLASGEIPTGSAKDALGNGSFDGAVALLASKAITPGLMSYANAGFVLPGNIHAYETLKTNAYFHGGAALELEIFKRFNAILQSTFMTSPLPTTGIREVDNPSVVLAVGARYDLGKSRVECSFVEDLNTSAAPDFTINVAYKLYY